MAKLRFYFSELIMAVGFKREIVYQNKRLRALRAKNDPPPPPPRFEIGLSFHIAYLMQITNKDLNM